MKHVFYALFDTRDAVDAALRDLSAYRITEAQCSIVIHNGPPIASELNASESDAREGIITGLLLGGAFGGLLAGALAIALDAIPMDPIVTTLIGAVGGGVYGALGGLLIGQGTLDRHLDELTTKMAPDKILVTAEVEGLDLEEAVEEVFRRHGAAEAEKTTWPTEK